MTYEGTVIGLKKRSAVVMTGDCQFKEIRRTPGMTGGLKVRFTDADLYHPAVKTPLRLAAVAASLLICFLLAYSLLPTVTGKPAFAYISLEVNPALEISLDREMKVIKATGLNRDGLDITEGLNISGQDAAEAVQNILVRCVEKSYLAGKQNRVLLTTTFAEANNGLQEKLDNRIGAAARRAVAAGQSGITVYVFNADMSVREQAVNKGVSTGRYLLWQDARDSGQQCDLDSPLSSPAFSRSADRLAVPLNPIDFQENSAPSGPASQGAPYEGAGQPPSSSPGAGAAPESAGNQPEGGFSPSGVPGYPASMNEKQSGGPDGNGSTSPPAPAGAEVPAGGPGASAGGVPDNQSANGRSAPVGGSYNGMSQSGNASSLSGTNAASEVKNNAPGPSGGNSVQDTTGSGSGAGGHGSGSTGSGAGGGGYGGGGSSSGGKGGGRR